MDKRKAFKFFRSYWEVGKELKEKDRIKFYDAILLYQFTGEVTELKGLARFAFISQKHNLDSQVSGYQTYLGGTPHTPLDTLPDTPSTTPPDTSIRERESIILKEKEEEKEKEKPEKIELPFEGIEFEEAWSKWKLHKRVSGDIFHISAEKEALKKLNRETEGDVKKAIEAIENSLSGTYKGIFVEKPKPTFKPKETEQPPIKRVYL